MTQNATTPFRTQREADAYTLLHEQGVDAYDAAFGKAGNLTLNDWIDAKLARISWPNGGYAIHTFKKYAGLRVTDA